MSARARGRARHEHSCFAAGVGAALGDGSDYRLAAPVVILNLNRFGVAGVDAPFNQVASLLAGGLTAQEKIIIGGNSQTLKQAAQTVHARRKEYMVSLDVASRDRFSFLNHPTTLLPVQNAVEAIVDHKDRALFVQLGNVDQPLYYYALYRTNMFSLFEGANSTSAAINIGKPFLALPRVGSGASPALYPTVNRGYFSSSPPINDLATAANQLNFDLGAWPVSASSNPCRQLGQFLQTLTDQVSADDPIPRYFRDVKAQYSTSDADKVNVALAYLMNIYQEDHPDAHPELVRRSRATCSASTP